MVLLWSADGDVGGVDAWDLFVWVGSFDFLGFLVVVCFDFGYSGGVVDVFGRSVGDH